MEPDMALIQLLDSWVFAAGPAKDIAFNSLINYMATRPDLARLMIGGAGGAAYEVYLLRLFAARAGARIAQRLALPILKLYVQRLGANLMITEKIPNPYIGGLIFVGAVLLTGCQTKTDNQQYDDAKPSYDLYVKQYTFRMVQAKKFHPNAKLSSPQEFPDWYEENRT